MHNVNDHPPSVNHLIAEVFEFSLDDFYLAAKVSSQPDLWHELELCLYVCKVRYVSLVDLVGCVFKQDVVEQLALWSPGVREVRNHYDVCSWNHLRI